MERGIIGRFLRRFNWSLIAVVLGAATLVIVGLTLLFGCGRPAEAEPDDKIALNLALTGVEHKIESKEALSVAVMDKTIEGIYIGTLIAKQNLRLTIQEQLDIGHAIVHYSNAYGLDPLLVVSVIEVESGGDIRARSPKGALGLMQVMPDWPQKLGLSGDLLDIDFNIRIGSFILSENIRKYGFETGIKIYVAGTLNHQGKQAHDYLAKVKREHSALRGS